MICADAVEAACRASSRGLSFDAVLVDAPCAGLGTLRRHPELKLRRQAAGPARGWRRCSATSCAAVARYAKPGAPVTYAICSLSREEGPEVVAAALAEGWRRDAPPRRRARPTS